MMLIVGLGNPGPKYETTRHNAGFLLLDEIASLSGISWKTSQKFGSMIGQGQVLKRECLLLKPLNYMNLSGSPVAAVMRYYQLTGNQLIVISDDLDQEPQQVKMRFGGGHGGHNGLRDILSHLTHGDFYRLKIGIGKPQKDSTVDWVLGQLSDQELLAYQNEVLKTVLERIEGIFKQEKV